MSDRSEPDKRAERLAAQLRANLRRRKANTRGKAENAGDADLSKESPGG